MPRRAPLHALIVAVAAGLATACQRPGAPSAPPGAPPYAGDAAPVASLYRGRYAPALERDLFTDCATGRVVPVARVNDAIELFWAWSDSEARGDADALAVLEGRVMPWRDGAGRKGPHLVVERFVRLEPAAACARSAL